MPIKAVCQVMSAGVYNDDGGNDAEPTMVHEKKPPQCSEKSISVLSGWPHLMIWAMYTGQAIVFCLAQSRSVKNSEIAIFASLHFH